MIRSLFLFFLCVYSALTFAASDFAVKDSVGVTHHLSDYKGKWLLVNYWATWCPPCLEEIPDLVSLYDEHHGKDLMVIGVSVDYKSTKEVAKYVDDMLMSYPIILGDDKASGLLARPEVLPTTYIYNPEGKLVKTKQGVITKAYVEKLISETKLGQK